MKARAWYSGTLPPDQDALVQAEEAEGVSTCLYAVEDGMEEGEWTPVIQSLRGKMDGLRGDPEGHLREYCAQSAWQAFCAALHDFALSLGDRVRSLQKLGDFTFDATMTPDGRKVAVAAALATPASTRGVEGDGDTAPKLGEIWQPDGLTRSVLQEPAEVAAAIADRLDPAHPSPIAIIGHTFAGAPPSALESLAQANTVAYERDAQIHVITAVREALERWEEDASIQPGPEDFSLLEAVLTHEILEVVLHESEALAPLPAHIVASAVDRCLRGATPALAVEAFCLEWLPTVTASPSPLSEPGPLEEGLDEEEMDEAAQMAAGRSDEEQSHILESMFSDESEGDAGSTAGDDIRVEPSAEAGPLPRQLDRQDDSPEDVASLFDVGEVEATPVVDSEADTAAAAAAADPERKRHYNFERLPDTDGKRVLVADDSSMARHMVCEVVRKLGHQSIQAMDGVEAVAMAHFHQPDLIVLDITMPGGNGLQALRDLRKTPSFQSTPIIMLTVESGRAHIQTAIRSGATEYLVKPIDLKELRKRVVKHLGDAPE